MRHSTRCQAARSRSGKSNTFSGSAERVATVPPARRKAHLDFRGRRYCHSHSSGSPPKLHLFRPLSRATSSKRCTRFSCKLNRVRKKAVKCSTAHCIDDLCLRRLQQLFRLLNRIPSRVAYFLQLRRAFRMLSVSHLAAAKPDDVTATFCRICVRKEAILKGECCGIDGSLRSFSVATRISFGRSG
jgi:hypothetical protein